jgi:enoyl-CoA hydratase/carnithine racemase
MPADRAAQYGYVNRVLPDNELDAFVDQFARRIAAFDRVAVSGIKRFVDIASLPEDSELADGLAAFFATSGRAAHVPFIRTLFEQGLQQADGVELDLGHEIGRLRQGQPATNGSTVGQ